MAEQKKKTRPTYTDAQIQKVLDSKKKNGLSNKKAADSIGCSEASVRKWLKISVNATTKDAALPARKQKKSISGVVTIPTNNFSKKIAVLEDEIAALKELLKLYLK